MLDESTSTAQQDATTASAPEGTTTAPEGTSGELGKIYTQADVDNAVEGRLSRERKKFPPKEELDAYHTWRDGQQTETQKQQRILEERNGFERRVGEMEAQIEEARRERLLLAHGASTDDVDYYAYKIGKMVDDNTTFDKAAERFFKEKGKPESSKGAQPPVTVSFSAGQGTAPQKSPNQKMNDILRGVRK